MTTAFEIPTGPAPRRQLVTLNGTAYTLVLTWNNPSACWMLEIDDDQGNLILGCQPLVTGSDLLAQFEYLGIGNGGSLIVQSTNDPDAVPTFESLGSTGKLFFVSPT